MANHFIAVGGTGQHVALAYADLEALAWLVLNNVQPAEFYILDRDQGTNENDSAWDLTLVQLNAIRPGQKNPWREIEPNKRIPGKPNVGAAVDACYGPLYFNPRQLDVDYSTGYYGQAPVGAAFFDDVLRQQQSQMGASIQHLITDPGARILVAGSLVGGTGAGCMPRLVEFLKKHSQASAIFAIPFLRWFQLSPQQSDDPTSARNAEMKSREPSALLYSSHRLARDAATVLVGHPQPDNAPQRPWAGDVKQKVFDQLVLPYCGAIQASRMLHEKHPPGTGLYSVPCVPSHIAKGLAVFGGDVDGPRTQIVNLVRLNVELCRRLVWVYRLLKEPPDFRRTWFPRSFHIPVLDGVIRLAKTAKGNAVLAGLKTILDAKWAALRRFFGSDKDLFGGTIGESWESMQDPPAEGLKSMQAWLDGDPLPAQSNAQDIAGRVVENIDSVHTVKAHPVNDRLLPPGVKPDTQATYPPVPLGDLDPLDLATVLANLVAGDLVLPESLPTVKTLEFFLEKLFAGQVGVGQSAAGKDWTRRWRLLLVGLCSGDLTLVPGPADMGEVNLGSPSQFLVQDGKKNTWGWISPSTLLVPAVQADWQKLENDPRLNDGGDAALRVAGWVQALNELNSKSPRKANIPGWAVALLQWASGLKAAPVLDFGLPDTPAPAPTVRWGDVSANLPLPFAIARPRANFDRLINFFCIPIAPADPASIPDLSQLANPAICPVYCKAPGRSQLSVAVWADILPHLASAVRFGFHFQQDGNGTWQALRLQLGANKSIEIIDDVHDIFIRKVEPIGDNTRTVVPDWPVKLQYAGLVDQARGASHQESAGNVSYTLHLRGRDQPVTTSVKCDRKRAATLLFWPRFRSGSTVANTFKAYYALYDTPATEMNVLGVRSAASLFLDWHQPVKSFHRARPLYAINNGNVDGGVPTLFALTEDSAKEGHGLFGIKLKQVDAVPAERWGIDFGSSSSVVAVSGADGGSIVNEALPLAADGSLDQTLPVALQTTANARLVDCGWFPTWDTAKQRSTPARPLVPSVMINITNAPLGNLLALHYIADYVVDHGGDLASELQGSKHLIHDFKWFPKDNQAQSKSESRQAYLVHLLELCYTLRAKAECKPASISPGLPQVIDARFTLPIAMRHGNQSYAQTYEQDVLTACSVLNQLLGCTINPTFNWESRAAIPITALQNETYACADLGGSSLDMWGGFGCNLDQDWADSYRFGGHDLVELWAAVKNMERMGLRRVLQTGDGFNIRDPDLANTTRGFFILAAEAVSRWVAALALKRAEASGQRKVSIKLALLGMGWNLEPGSQGKNTTLLLEHIQERANGLLRASGSSALELTLLEMNEQQQGDDRKTYIARRAAVRPGYTMTALLGAPPRAFLGFNAVSVSGVKHQTHPWSADKPLKVPSGASQMVFDPDHGGSQPVPALEKHKLTANQLGDVITAMSKGILGLGMVPQFDGQSPISAVLEVLRHDTKA